MSSSGASATWRKPIRSPGMPASAGAVVAARQHVEGVDGQRHGGVVGAPYDVPGLADPVDVPAPGERLVGDRHAVLGGEVAERRAAARR